MSRTRIWTLASLVTAALVALAVTGSAAGRTEGAASASALLKMPRWVVTGKQATPDAANILSESLGTFDAGFTQNGGIDYLDPEAFLNVPTIDTGEEGKDESGNPTLSEALDIQGLQSIAVIEPDKAIELTEGALADAKLDPLDGTRGATRTPTASNSFFDVFMGDQQIHQPIDTVVNYDLGLGRLNTPLVGPGADVRLSFNGDETATSVHYALWSMRQGSNVVIIPAAQATKLARQEYASQCGGGILRDVKLSQRLVYYAPPLSLESVRAVMPAYEFGGTAQSGQETVDLRQVYVPAQQAGLRVSMNASAEGRTVTARAIVRGGQPPFTYSWESCQSSIDPNETGPVIRYEAGGRLASRRETLTVHVTDANGLTGSASRSVNVTGGTQGVFTSTGRFNVIGPVDVGSETVGTSMGLPGCIPDTTGFNARMALSGIPTQFLWMNLNAWERDFKDPSKPSGQDQLYADDVDETFYCGHANGNGFSFPGSQTDGFLDYNDAFWGNRDLEWLGIAACGPLQNVSNGLQWYQRWGPAFGGLHLLLGYETTSSDVTGEGFDFANNQLGTFWWGTPMKVRDSWIWMAIANQGSSVRWAEMGVFGPGGVTNYNDYFWGKGPTGPDIFPGSFTGFWKISGPS
jgi:hypothetical protein